MKRTWRIRSALIVAACGVMTPALAAEQPSATAKPAGATAATAPQVTPAEGTIAMVDLTSPAPSVRLNAPDGRSWTFAMDPKTIMVWNNGRLGKPEDLMAGSQVKVRYQEKGGEKWAKSIEIVQVPKASPTAASPGITGSANASTAAVPATPGTTPAAPKKSY